jgi:hypothetical protein
LLSTVVWNGGGNDSNWGNPQNWNTHAVPATGDDVVIDTGSSAATVTMSAPDTASLNSLTMGGNDTLSLSGSSLTVNDLAIGRNDTLINSGYLMVDGNVTLQGSLSMTAGTLAVSGAGASMTLNGITALSDAGLIAEAGATLSLPNLVSCTGQDYALVATGAGSTLTLANLTALPGGLTRL